MISGLAAHFVIAWMLLPMPGSQTARPAQSTHSPHGNLTLPCESCHTEAGWTPIRAIPEFDHNQTKFPLRGLHEGVQCTQCHVKPVFTNVGAKCSSCHADLHKGQFGAACEQCHSVKGWNVAIQQVKEHQNRFPLIGGHAALECETCHTGAATGQFQGLSTACYSCHAKTYQNTSGPSHVATAFPTTCEQCHSVNTWFDAKFDHSKFTNFALTGVHTTLQCTQCHIGGQFKGTPATCVGCHLPAFQGTDNPSHVKLNLPQTCQNCHTTAAWMPAFFDHALVGFALTGAHAPLQCSQCHTNNNYNLTNTECVSCHLKNFQDTSNPNHAQSGFPQTCATCHNTTTWLTVTFNHSNTGFPLTGAHVPLQCSLCHINNNYNLKTADCVNCHLPQYQGATDPNHVTQSFPQTCQNCHSTVNWLNATFNHSSTGFALTGAHVPLACSQCHINGNYNLTSGACVNCHLKEYQATTDPNHVASGFPQTCESCHSTTSWAGAIFNHASTGFALTGAHVPLQCVQCHVNNNYTLKTAACVDCHLKQYNSTTNPNHAAAGFPQQCELCHGTTVWTDSTFNHNNTPFPLTGAHTTLACASCHVNNNYTTLPTDCYGCHKSQYQSTTNPNHMAAGFPTTCQTCHTTQTWLGAVFNHTYFPTPHHGISTCTDCHTNANDYKVFTCTGCHSHPKAETDSHHQGVSGYVYNSTNCLACHPTGSGGG